MRLTTTLILIVAAAIMALLWFVAGDDEGTPAEPLFGGIDAGEVRRLAIRRDDIEIVLARHGDRWRMTGPVEAAGNPERIEKTLDAFLPLTAQAGGIVDASPERYGLDSPRVRLTIETAGGKSRSIAIGQSVPLSEVVAARRGEGPLFVIPEEAARLVDAPPIQWVERRLVRMEPEAARRIGVRAEGAEGGYYELIRREGRWMLDTGRHEWRASAEATGELLDELTGAEAVDIVVDPPPSAVLGFDDPRVTVEVTDEAGEHAQLILGKNAPDREAGLYARRGDLDTIWIVQPDVLLKLNRPATLYRDRRLLDAGYSEVAFVELGQGDEAFRLQPKGDGWTMLGKDAKPRPAHFESTYAMVNRLVKATVESFVAETVDDPARYGFDDPSVVVTVGVGRQAATPETVTLVFGRSTDDNALTYVRRTDEPAVYTVSGELAELLRPSPLAYRDRTVHALAQGQTIRRVTIERGDRRTVVARGDGVWSFVEPELPRARLDAWRMEDLLGILRRMQATSLVTNEPGADAGRFGFKEPWATVRFVVSPEDGADRTYTLILGGQVDTGEARYATFEDDPLVFALDPQAVRTLTAELTRP